MTALMHKAQLTPNYNFWLALLDYVSRAHGIAICPSSVRPSVRRPSVVRLCRNYL